MELCGATAGQLITRATVRAAASMVKDGRDSTIWVQKGPGRISGAAEGALNNLTFAAKDLYDVSCFRHGCCMPLACQAQVEHAC